MLIGYARVSTHDQNLRLQLDALERVGCDKIFQDQGISGIRKIRPGLSQAMASLDAGDTLVVWRLDRLGRNIRHLIETVEDMARRNIQLRSLHEAIDTETSGGKLLFHMMAALAEFERNLISERTLAGLAASELQEIQIAFDTGGELATSSEQGTFKNPSEKSSRRDICDSQGLRHQLWSSHLDSDDPQGKIFPLDSRGAVPHLETRTKSEH